MKVSTEIDNNFGYEKITQLVDNIPLKVEHFQVYDLVTVCFDYASEILRTRYREPV